MEYNNNLKAFLEAIRYLESKHDIEIDYALQDICKYIVELANGKEIPLIVLHIALGGK